MMNSHFFVLLMSLLVDGGGVAPLHGLGSSGTGTAAPPLDASKVEERIVAPSSDASGSGAGAAAPPPSSSGPGTGTVTPQSTTTESIRWPDEVRPVATLDGPAVLAAHAVLQNVLARFPKEYAGSCSYSAKALEVIVGQEDGLYFVEVKRRVDKCGWAAPGTSFDLDWFELYAVSPDGRILGRYPYHP